MKKKLRDFAIEEAVQICDSHKTCSDKCPFRFDGICCWDRNISSVSEDTEVEIPDEVFKKTEQVEEEDV